MLRNRFIAPVLLAAPLLVGSLHAQTVKVAKNGTLSVTFAANVEKLFNQQNINVAFIGTSPIARGENFNVTGGAVNLATGSGSANSQGAIVFNEGDNSVALNALDLLGTSPNAYITADVVINGQDQGRFPVFLLVANLYEAPLTPGKYNSGSVRFSINPEFQSEFADYIPITGLDPTAPLGTFDLKVTIK